MLRDDGDRALGSFLGHLVLYEPNDRCDDRSSDAAAHRLTEKSTNIHAAGCITQHRQKRGEDLTSDATSNCAAKYRELAEMAKDAATKQELSELAAACEGIADQIDDLRSSG